MSAAHASLIAAGVLLFGSCLLSTRLGGADLPPPPNPISAAERAALADGNNRLACDLLRRLTAGEPGNLFFSPFSIRTALAMTYAGAKGATAAEMKQSLHFGLEDERLHTALGEAIAALNAGGPGHPELAVANSLWGDLRHRFLPSFLSLNETVYGSALEPVDFLGASEAVRQQINGWVAERTRQKIVDLIPTGGVSSATTLVLVNAVYFKGSWKDPFDAEETTAAPWADGGKVIPPMQVQLMQRSAPYAYTEQRLVETPAPGGAAGAGLVQILELPYAGDTLSMIVLLPRPATALADVIRGLTAAKLATAVAALRTQEVRLALPRFTMTWGTHDLGPHGLSVLPDLGLRQAFAPAQADFSGMDGSRGFAIGGVFHKAFVDVREEGTEAAAATAAGMSLCMEAEQHVVSFRADRPFVFIIRERASGMILFAGCLQSP